MRLNCQATSQKRKKQLLDKFISRLKQDPQATGLIRMDSERKRFSQFRLSERIMDYLKNTHSSEVGRIKLMEMSRLKNEIELFIMPPKGKLIPSPLIPVRVPVVSVPQNAGCVPLTGFKIFSAI